MQLVLEFLALPFVQDVLKILFILLLFAMPLGTFMTLMERKWSAAVQDRIGPNRANIGSYRGRGLLHIAADALKSIFKEDLIPRGADKFLYTIAPFFSFMSDSLCLCIRSSWTFGVLLRLLGCLGLRALETRSLTLLRWSIKVETSAECCFSGGPCLPIVKLFLTLMTE